MKNQFIFVRKRISLLYNWSTFIAVVKTARILQ